MSAPRCPECQRALLYALGMNRWECTQHGPIWSGEALVHVRAAGETP